MGPNTEQSSTVFHTNRNMKGINSVSTEFVMRFWESIKKRLNKNCMKTMKKKANAGLELIAMGGFLIGGSVIMEKLTETSSPQISA